MAIVLRITSPISARKHPEIKDDDGEIFSPAVEIPDLAIGAEVDDEALIEVLAKHFPAHVVRVAVPD